ncbi:MAG: tryptophan synthase subunit alpha [Planctomycetes bacterium]|nr:tryptophan synthase subunit alpha [Planctomycetota bacterium]MCW8136422.1 tryptophan synthase subunit alpha [Planctomycetota bacterium]
MADSVAQAFAKARDESRAALLPFLMSGHPTPQAFAANLHAAAAHADIIEVGVPFSDPLADGPVIQAAAAKALGHGTTLSGTLEALRLRAPGPPVVLMLGINQVLARGVDKFAKQAAEAGVSGAIVPDLPHEEAGEIRAAFTRQGLCLIAMLAPTTPQPRMRTILGQARGFAYLISVAGVTGARDSLPTGTIEYLRRAREHSPVPVCVGFGISKPEHIEHLRDHADGVVVGSALVRALEGGATVADVLSPLRLACRRAASKLPQITGAKP